MKELIVKDKLTLIKRINWLIDNGAGAIKIRSIDWDSFYLTAVPNNLITDLLEKEE